MNQTTLLLILLAYFTPFTSTSVFGSDLVRSVQVSGTCTRRAIPDRGQVTVTAEAQEMDAQKAVKTATEKFEKFKDDAKRLNLPDYELQSQEYSVTSVNEWEKQKQQFKGYRVRIGSRITTSALSKLGEVVALASRLEIKEVGSLSATLSEDKLRTEQRECLKAAALDAQARAEKLAQTLGSSLGKAMTIREHGVSATPVYQERVMMAADSLSAGAERAPVPQFEAGTQEVRMALEVVFELR